MSSARTPLYRFLSPRYWPVWLGIGLMRLGTLPPHRAQLWLGRRIGRLLYHTARKRRSIARRNLTLCFPDQSRAAREDLLRRHFESVGAGFFEIGMSWWAGDERLRPLASIEGLEHVHLALQQGKGAILLSSHTTLLEIGCRLLCLYLQFHPMYRRHENALFQEVMLRGRERAAGVAIRKDDVRQMLKSLRQNHPVWYAPDQAYRGKNSAMVPFFSIPAPTNTGTSRLARVSGAPVVPFFPYRDEASGRYHLVLLPALEEFPTDDAIADASRINRLIEQRVRLQPAQYLWLHRRFKNLNADQADLYAAARQSRA